jgi:hypothetical protein
MSTVIGGADRFQLSGRRLVVSGEVDASWSVIDGNAKCTGTLKPVCHTRVDSLGTVTGRLGYSYGNLLLYGRPASAGRMKI